MRLHCWKARKIQAAFNMPALSPGFLLLRRLPLQCGCDGRWIDECSPRGAKSWRTHHNSARHMAWKEANPGYY